MDPISVNTAVAMANAFRAFVDGDAGSFTTEYKDTRYTLVSAQNQVRDGPLVTFKLENRKNGIWSTLMEFDGVVGVFATDALVIITKEMNVRIVYEVPEVPDGNYTVQPMPPRPFPRDQCTCECTTQRFEDETP